MESIIRAGSLTTFEVSTDGTKVRLNLLDERGNPAALELPAECMNQLLMTLPRIIQMALRRNQQDDSLRLVYPMEAFRLEAGDVDEHGVQRYILTLQTQGQFEISFAIKDNALGRVAQTIIDQVMENPQARLEPVTLNS